MKRILILLIAVFAVLFVFVACAEQNNETDFEEDDEREEEKVIGYTQITQDEARRLMDTEENYIILDVRTQEEYDKAHIPNSVLIPDYEIEEKYVVGASKTALAKTGAKDVILDVFRKLHIPVKKESKHLDVVA